MKSLAVLALALALSLSASAQKSTPEKSSSKGSGVEQQIKNLEDQSNQAALKGDAAWAKAHSTANYTFIDPQGGLSSGEDNAPQPKFTQLDPSEQSVRVFGNTAVVVEKIAVKGTVSAPSGEQSIDGNYRLTRIWVKQGGQWKIASGQVTKISAGGM